MKSLSLTQQANPDYLLEKQLSWKMIHQWNKFLAHKVNESLLTKVKKLWWKKTTEMPEETNHNLFFYNQIN